MNKVDYINRIKHLKGTTDNGFLTLNYLIII